MHITAVTPFTVGHVRDFLFVKVETDAGITGIGESGITWQERAVSGMVESLGEAIVGEDPLRTEHLWQVMFRGGFFPLGRIACAALSAIDIALWDIKAKHFDVPLYRLLGGPVREKVVCYAHIRGESSTELADEARKKVDAGWGFVRFDPRGEADGVTFEPAAAVRRCVKDFAAIRHAVGDDIEICVDVHTRLDPADAISLCRRFEEYRPYFVEDPLRSENFQSYRRLAAHADVPIAAGEQFASKWDHRQLIEEELIDYARTDVCIAGGVTETLKIAGWCETHGINMAFHNPLGPVATAVSLHLDLAVSNFAVQELARPPGTVLPELFPVQVPFEEGYLLPPTGPGLGVEFNEAALPKYPRIPGGRTPRFQRADGAFTNW